MKFSLVASFGCALAGTASAAQFQAARSKTPMAQVVQLLSGMKARIEGDGMAEQQSYDRYACWCEDTLARKASDISAGQQKIEDLQALIIKLKSEIASHGAEIKQLGKDIQQNLDSQGEARAVRDSEFEDYNGEKTESEQCIGALEAAVKALAGAGTGKFLETSVKEAELLSVVAGVRAVMGKASASKGMSGKDLELVRHFVDSPADFASRRNSGQFAQVSNNPFGDYAPQSTQIQGILKGMYDTFASDLEKANVKEADSQKSFEALMQTKLHELETLKDTLRQQELDHAQKSQTQAESQEMLDATKAQLEADEAFFDETKGACQVKSREWNERSRLRTMELAGVNKAIEILNSPEALKTFADATTTFVQLSSAVTRRRSGSSAATRVKAFKRLAIISRKFHSLGLAEIAATIKAGGHFDKVISSIDRMVELLRAEEQADIEHRDRCENAEGKNSNDMEDLNAAISKAGKSIQHLGLEAGRLDGEIDVLDHGITETNGDMAQLLHWRNADVAEFRQAIKDDTAAVALIEQAMVALRRFFDKNDIKLSLHAKKGDPEYSADKDKAPETMWDGANYGGRKEESGGIVAIMEMLIEDVQKEMKTARADEAKAQQLYEQQRGAMQDMVDKQMATKLATEREMADVQSMKASTEEHQTLKTGDLAAEQGLKSALYSDCSWVKTHFAPRRDKRKSEMDGLVEAKGYLAGVAAEAGL